MEKISNAGIIKAFRQGILDVEHWLTSTATNQVGSKYLERFRAPLTDVAKSLDRSVEIIQLSEQLFDGSTPSNDYLAKIPSYFIRRTSASSSQYVLAYCALKFPVTWSGFVNDVSRSGGPNGPAPEVRRQMQVISKVEPFEQEPAPSPGPQPEPHPNKFIDFITAKRDKFLRRRHLIATVSAFFLISCAALTDLLTDQQTRPQIGVRLEIGALPAELLAAGITADFLESRLVTAQEDFKRQLETGMRPSDIRHNYISAITAQPPLLVGSCGFGQFSSATKTLERVKPSNRYLTDGISNSVPSELRPTDNTTRSVDELISVEISEGDDGYSLSIHYSANGQLLSLVKRDSLSLEKLREELALKLVALVEPAGYLAIFRPSARDLIQDTVDQAERLGLSPQEVGTAHVTAAELLLVQADGQNNGIGYHGNETDWEQVSDHLRLAENLTYENNTPPDFAIARMIDDYWDIWFALKRTIGFYYSWNFVPDGKIQPPSEQRRAWYKAYAQFGLGEDISDQKVIDKINNTIIKEFTDFYDLLRQSEDDPVMKRINEKYNIILNEEEISFEIIDEIFFTYLEVLNKEFDYLQSRFFAEDLSRVSAAGDFVYMLVDIASAMPGSKDDLTRLVRDVRYKATEAGLPIQVVGERILIRKIKDGISIQLDIEEEDKSEYIEDLYSDRVTINNVEFTWDNESEVGIRLTTLSEGLLALRSGDAAALKAVASDIDEQRDGCLAGLLGSLTVEAVSSYGGVLGYLDLSVLDSEIKNELLGVGNLMLTNARGLEVNNFAFELFSGEADMLFGVPDNAETHFREALKYHGPHFQALNGLAESLLDQGRHDQALIHAREAAEIHPYAAELRMITEALSGLHRYEEILSFRSEYAEKGDITGIDHHFFMHFAQRDALCSLGRFDEAEALSLQTTHAPSYGELLVPRPNIDYSRSERALHRQVVESLKLAERYCGNPEEAFLCAGLSSKNHPSAELSNRRVSCEI